ncbi:MAG: response regulator [Paracoccus sp. (in: a-proteobacteria)]|uniref:response regulator n=1 Tax=Paracoccus sp. TaxID=267 RepID=UPI0026DF9F1E|nr:response regulator [Paracoccus sp. (in: a-proteobacteria)]MDO5622024.1 response regulator [Paracoccus sp. (in: a-proteobacteria)]
MSIKEKLHVMVVDDMSTSRGLLVQSLEAFGIRNIRSAAHAGDALKELTQRPAHLVISDLNMPDIDGLQLLENLRNSDRLKNTGFILITGRADAEVINRGKRLGMNNFIKKPFSAQDLKACVEAVTGRL